MYKNSELELGRNWIDCLYIDQIWMASVEQDIIYHEEREWKGKMIDFTHVIQYRSGR